jgi:hypothetical protein
MRPTKYYVSTKDGAFNGGITRLSEYFTDKHQAEAYFRERYHAYDTLFVRELSPDNKTRRTLASK